jgi:hypothetical protein
MSAWFERHPGVAAAVLGVVVCLLVLAMMAAATRHFLVAGGSAVLALALWQQIESTIAGGRARSKRTRGR